MDELMSARLKKLEALRARGADPFSWTRYERTHTAAEVVARFSELEGKQVTIAGRVHVIRRHGKAAFADVYDATGKIQIHASVDGLGEEFAIVDLLDGGDIVGVRGTVFKTRRGEVTVEAERIDVLCKALRGLPEKWHGLKDVEIRFRQRYLDLIINREVRELFIARSRMINFIRQFLCKRGFIEVETPMMQPIAGGATARPFVTYHNALGIDLYLRIAPELYLKRLIVGGFERVFELNRNFRNEGISRRHNPEFTMLEFYLAYANYEDMMRLCEELVAGCAEVVCGSTRFVYNGQEIDVAPPWRRLAVADALRQFAGVELADLYDDAAAQRIARERELRIDGPVTCATVLNKLLDEFVEPRLIQPTFLVGYPTIVSPLAKRSRDNPQIAERFEPFVGGQELGNGFSEINDPIDQRKRFEEQLRQRRAGAEDAHPMDEDFLRALEHGMPPTGGFGLGIDRLLMVLTDSKSIRDVILFPQLRPEE